MNLSSPTLYTIADAANKLGVSTKTLRRWEKKGIIAPVRTAGNQRRYSVEQLSAVIRKNEVTPPSAIPVASYLTHLKRHWVLGAALATLAVGIGVGRVGPGMVAGVQTEMPLAPTLDAAVLGKMFPDYIFTVNIPSQFSKETHFSSGVTVDGGLILANGTITASNVLYSLKAGDGISITTGQTPTITNTGVKSITAGTGISIDGNKITNTYSFTPDYTQSGWTRSGTTVKLTTLTDAVEVAALTASSIVVNGISVLDGTVTIGNGVAIIPDTDLGSDLGSSTYRFNNLWVANINSNSSQSFSGQTTFSYPPTDATITQASVLINPTTSATNGQLLAIGLAGYQRALIDEDGDITLGYADPTSTSAPASDYPLNIYGHSGTRVSFVDTSGNGYFAGNVGIGTTSPSFNLDVASSVASNFIARIYNSKSDTGSGLVIRAGGTDSQRYILAGYDYNNSARFAFSASGGVGIGGGSYFATDPGAGNLIVQGNVGIGTTSPGAVLDINGTANISQHLNLSRIGFGSTDGIIGFDGTTSGAGTQIFSLTRNTTTVGTDLKSYGVLSFLTNGSATEKMRIDTSGNVGIGTTSPSKKLNVNAALGSNDTWGGISYFQVDNTSGNDGGLLVEGVRSNTAASRIAGIQSIDTGNVVRDLILQRQGGKVGIGTTSPGTKLDVASTTNEVVGLSLGTTASGYGNGGQVFFNGAGIGVASIKGTYTNSPTDNGLLEFKTSLAGAVPATRMAINGANVGIGTTSPSKNLVVGTDIASGYSNPTMITVANSGASSGFLVGQAGSNALSMRWGYNATAANATAVIETAGYSNPIYIDGQKLILQANSSGNVGIGTTNPGTKLDIGSSDLGDGAAGPVITLGRNTNATNAGAGSVNFLNKDGTAGYVWQDAGGLLRINTAAPTTANDTQGTVVGAQSSSLASKNVLGEFTDYQGALSTVLNTPLFNFNYKSGAFNNEEFTGIITDYSPAFGMDNGKSLNVINGLGYTIGAIKEQQNQIMNLRLDPTAIATNSAKIAVVENRVGILEQLLTEIKVFIDSLKEKFTTKQVCLSDQEGELCLDKAKLQEILNNLPSPSPSLPASSSATLRPEPTIAAPTPTQEITPDSTPSATPTQEASASGIQ